MCGLAGAVSFRPSRELLGKVNRALSLLSHRGPDDEGVSVVETESRRAVLGHRRLSIIDLSDAGHQPMTSRDGRFTVVYNGEVYNYREIRQELIGLGHSFFTETDTEVLLSAWALWGESVLTRFIGMFAFAVVDSELKTLTLVRDGFGIKPLFWSNDDDELCFASEIEALGSLRKRDFAPNNSVIARYLMTGSYDTGHETFFDDVWRLEPGHLIEVDLAGNRLEPQIRRWWTPQIGETGPRKLSEAEELIRSTFLDSVKLHLRSDVALGFALSGGIDSSATVCAARYLEPDMPLNTFSFVAPGSPENEEEWIDLVNNHVGARPFQVSSDSSTLHADLLDLVRSQGEPFGDTSIYAQYIVYRLVKESGVTVTLDGQGADEIFAGYSGYVERRLISLVEEWKFGEAMTLLSRWSNWPGRHTSRAIRDLLSLNLPDSLIARVRNRLGSGRGGFNSSWFHEDVAGLYSRGSPRSAEERGRHLVSMLRFELTEGGLGNLMRHGDRNSMRWSIESRVPFLTIPLAEAALSLPEEFLLSRNGETKHVLRQALRGIVPDVILDRRDKIGFQTPENAWLLGLKSEIMDSWLDGLERIPIVNAEEVREGLRSQLHQGKTSPEMWRYINLSLWADQFLPRESGPSWGSASDG